MLPLEDDPSVIGAPVTLVNWNEPVATPSAPKPVAAAVSVLYETVTLRPSSAISCTPLAISPVSTARTPV